MTYFRIKYSADWFRGKKIPGEKKSLTLKKIFHGVQFSILGKSCTLVCQEKILTPEFWEKEILTQTKSPLKSQRVGPKRLTLKLQFWCENDFLFSCKKLIFTRKVSHLASLWKWEFHGTRKWLGLRHPRGRRGHVLGFHMMSTKFNTKNYRSSRVFSFMKY